MKKNRIMVVITTIINGQKHYVSREHFTGDFTYVFHFTTDKSKAWPYNCYLEATKHLKWAEKSNRAFEIETVSIELPVQVSNSTSLN